MIRVSSLMAVLGLSVAISASAATYSVDFTGLVSQTQGATGQTVGSTVAGHFDLDSVSGSFSDFSIAGRSVASGFTSSASIGPAQTDAIYIAQVSPLVTGGTTNSTFTLDLSSLTTWPTTVNAFTLLTNTAQLSTNLDTVGNPASAFPSTFSYYTANANGTGVVALTANLSTISATSSAVPEPTSAALLGCSLLVLGWFGRRQIRRS